MIKTTFARSLRSTARRQVLGKSYGKPFLYGYSLLSKLRFSNSVNYWEKRYAKGANSGAGSYGRLAEFKAQFLNSFVEEHGVKSVVELGCGDGNQLSLAKYPEYTGLDVARTAVEICERRFDGDASKRFFVHTGGDECKADFSAEMAMSLDVIYHLVEDESFNRYMADLFSFATRFVVIYSSNYHGTEPVAHVRHRKFTDWVEKNTGWKLEQHTPNPFPYDVTRPADTSWADFYVFAPGEAA